MVIVSTSIKGGVGKSSLVLLLANNLASRGHKVLVIDMDLNNTSTIYYTMGIKNVQEVWERQNIMIALTQGRVEENIVHNELETPTVEQTTVEETPSTDVNTIVENAETITNNEEVTTNVQPEEQTVTEASVSSDEKTTVTDVPTDVNDAAQSSEGTAETAAQDTFVNTATSEKVSADEQKQEENSSSAALTNSERAEFEALKREKKEKLIDSYKDYLSEEEYNDFSVKIDSLQFEELETELLKVYKVKQEAKEETEVNERAFTLYSLLNKPVKESSLATLIKENLDK